VGHLHVESHEVAGPVEIGKRQVRREVSNPQGPLRANAF
jgi:hypothetical protein